MSRIPPVGTKPALPGTPPSVPGTGERSTLESARGPEDAFSPGVLKGARQTSAAAIPPSESPLFSEPGVMQFRLEAPFARMFREKNPSPDHPTGEGPAQPSYDGSLVYSLPDGTTRSLDVKVRVRGSTSLEALDFNKLKVKIADDQEKGTPFDDADTFKIGTHGGEEPEPSMGRLKNELATHREAFAYETLGMLGIPSLKARHARLTYVDTEGNGEPLVRDAMLLEDTDEAAKRYGAKEVDPPQPPAKPSMVEMPADERLRLRLANALLGNHDYRLPEERFPFGHNLGVIERPDGTRLMLPNDFDLSSFVTGHRTQTMDWRHDAFADKGDGFKSMLGGIVRARLEDPASFDRVLKELTRKLPDVLERLEEAPIDGAGKQNIQAHLTEFLEAAPVAASLAALREDTQVFYDEQGTKLVNGFVSDQPVEIVETHGEMTQVHLLVEGLQAREVWLKSSDLVLP
jgi:hypothetical protein